MSFEEFKQKVAEALGLMRTQDLLNSNPYGYYAERREPIRRFQGYRDSPVYYRADLDAVKHIPEFGELIAEEEETLAGGASKQEMQKYGTIAERAYKKKEEVRESIKQKLQALYGDYDGPGQSIYEAAEILIESQGGRPVATKLEEALLRDKFAFLKLRMESIEKWERKKREDALLQERFGERYQESTRNASEALRAQRMLAELSVMETRARARGFTSVQEMWAGDLGELRKLKEEVGEDGFRVLEQENRERRI